MDDTGTKAGGQSAGPSTGDPRRVYGRSRENKEAARSELWDLAVLEDVATLSPSALDRAPALYKWLFRVFGIVKWTPTPSGIDSSVSDAEWKSCRDKANEMLRLLPGCRPDIVVPAWIEDSARDGGRRIVTIHPGDGGNSSEVDFTHELDASKLSDESQKSKKYEKWERDLMPFYSDAKGMAAMLGLYGPGITIVNAENPLQRMPFAVGRYLARERADAESRGGTDDITHDRVDDETSRE